MNVVWQGLLFLSLRSVFSMDGVLFVNSCTCGRLFEYDCRVVTTYPKWPRIGWLLNLFVNHGKRLSDISSKGPGHKLPRGMVSLIQWGNVSDGIICPFTVSLVIQTWTWKKGKEFPHSYPRIVSRHPLLKLALKHWILTLTIEYKLPDLLPLSKEVLVKIVITSDSSCWNSETTYGSFLLWAVSKPNQPVW